MTKNQNHTIRTYFKDGGNFVELDQRSISITDDVTNAAFFKLGISKAAVFTPEVLEHFDFKFSEMNTLYTLENN